METITLHDPLVLISKENGEVVDKIETVNIRRLKTGDLLSALDGAGSGKEGSLTRHLISRATRLTLKQVDELEIGDFEQITEVLDRFLPNSLRTGGTQSSSSPEHSDTPEDVVPGDQKS